MSKCHLELCDFAINNISHCYKCPRIAAYQDLFQVFFNNVCFQLPQNDEITRMIRYKWENKSCVGFYFGGTDDLKLSFCVMFFVVIL